MAVPFDKAKWMQAYMREYRRGQRRRTKRKEMKVEQEKYRIYIDGAEDSYTLVDDYNDMFTEAWDLHSKGHSIRVTEALVRHVEIMSIPALTPIPKP